MRNFLSFLLLSLLAMPLLAQRPSYAADSAPSLHSAARISNHEDTPFTCWEFAWTDSSSTWDSTQQTTYTYFINGKVQEEVVSYYQQGGFALAERRVYAYYPDGKLSNTWLFFRNGNLWDSTIQRHYFYDGLGNDTLNYERQWMGLFWQTTSGERKQLTYRNVDQLNTMVSWQFAFSQGAYLRVDSAVYTYDANDLRASDTHYGWNGSGWDPSFRYLDYVWYNYPLELPISARKQVYGTMWQDQERFHATYGPFDSPTAIYEAYNGLNWDTIFKVVIENDAEGHETKYEYHYYQQGWQLALGELNAYTYNGAGQSVERIRQSFDGQGYVNDRKYIWDAFFLATDSPTSGDIAVQTFPNPVTDLLQFRILRAKPGLVRVQLYDLQGRLRAETRCISAGELIEFPISEGLENATYIYRLTTKEGTATGKVIVKH